MHVLDSKTNTAPNETRNSQTKFDEQTTIDSGTMPNCMSADALSVMPIFHIRVGAVTLFDLIVH